MTRLRAVAMVAGLALALVAYFLLFGTRAMDTIAELTARSTAQVLGALGTPALASGAVVQSPSLALTIVTECTATGPILLFVAAVLAYPAPLKGKLIGLALGPLFLLALNQVRLVSLYFIGANLPRYLPVAHYLVWQAAIILATILAWFIWAERAGHVKHS